MNVVYLKTHRVLKERQKEAAAYRVALLAMDKTQLLQELLAYHELYQRDPHDIMVTLRGQHLMDVLEERAELKDLQELSQEFQAKLQTRLDEQLKQIAGKF
ncbi:MAG: hypothetical protein AB1540_06485 [Bdellovibrionota bacterium]